MSSPVLRRWATIRRTSWGSAADRDADHRTLPRFPSGPLQALGLLALLVGIAVERPRERRRKRQPHLDRQVRPTQQLLADLGEMPEPFRGPGDADARDRGAGIAQERQHGVRPADLAEGAGQRRRDGLAPGDGGLPSDSDDGREVDELGLGEERRVRQEEVPPPRSCPAAGP